CEAHRRGLEGLDTTRLPPPGGSLAEVEREVQDLASLPEHDAKVELGRHLSDLIADPVGNDRGLRVVEHDAFLAVDPAGCSVDLGRDCRYARWKHKVAQLAALGIEDLAFPEELVRHPGDDILDRRAGSEEHRAVCLAFRGRPGRAP